MIDIPIMLKEGAAIPIKSHEDDAGYDLIALTKTIHSDGTLIMGTGVHMLIPKGYYGQLVNRSSISKYNMNFIIGTIDAGYKGEIMVQLKPSTMGRGSYEVGMKVAQIIIIPCPKTVLTVVNSLEDTDRGNNGLGSTGE